MVAATCTLLTGGTHNQVGLSGFPEYSTWWVEAKFANWGKVRKRRKVSATESRLFVLRKGQGVLGDNREVDNAGTAQLRTQVGAERAQDAEHGQHWERWRWEENPKGKPYLRGVGAVVLMLWQLPLPGGRDWVLGSGRELESSPLSPVPIGLY